MQVDLLRRPPDGKICNVVKRTALSLANGKLVYLYVKRDSKPWYRVDASGLATSRAGWNPSLYILSRESASCFCRTPNLGAGAHAVYNFYRRPKPPCEDKVPRGVLSFFTSH